MLPGLGPLQNLADSSWEDIDREWQDVVRPVFLLTHAALPLLREQKQGRIVNLAATLVARPRIGVRGAHDGKIGGSCLYPDTRA